MTFTKNTDVEQHWSKICDLMNKCFFCAIATVNEDGSPHITPIGSVILREDCTGYFIQAFTVKMLKNLERDPRVCILSVNASFLFWVLALLMGYFPTPPAVRLRGVVGAKREGTKEQLGAFRQQVRFARVLKGYDLLWGNLKYIRDIRFESFEPVQLGTMTRDVWQ